MASEKDNEESHLLNIFPNEVWKIILGNVKDATDYHKISNASPHFRNLLLSRGQLILFPEVVKILTEQNPFPKSFRWIVTRGVCHAWKKEMDKMLESQEYFVQEADEKIIDIAGIALDDEPVLYHKLYVASAEGFTRIEEHFDATHLGSKINPFLRRKIEFLVDYGNIEDLDRYYNACLRFLGKYGRHLWFCVIYYSINDTANLTDFYCRKLSTILELMPNLRALHVHNEVGVNISSDADIIPTQFPTLHQLDYIHFRGPPRVIVEQLLRANPQVECVDALRSGVGIHVVLEALPNLRALAFCMDEEEDEACLRGAQFTSRVERMWLDMSNMRANELTFTTLQRHFAGSLVELHLCPSWCVQPSAEARLELPKLKILHLEMIDPQRLEALLPLKDTLEELHLAMERKPSNRTCELEYLTPEQDQQFKVYKFWKQPQKSNIWALYPKLKILEMKLFKAQPVTYSCTRKEWQREIVA